MPRALAVVVILAITGCTPRPPLPAPPTDVSTLAVAAVDNQTGSELAISGTTIIARWIGRKLKTVPDVVRDQARETLRDKGFAVADGGAVPTLKITLRRFDPDLPQLAYVAVAVSATLADPDGTVRWTLDRPQWVVSTQGAPSMDAAYAQAAQSVGRTLVEDWQPAH